MSEHAIEVVSEYGELSLRLVCHAAKGSPCRMRPANLDIEEWTTDYEGEMIDSDCWAVEWQTAAGFEDGVRSELEGVYASIPVVVGYAEGVTVRPAGEHSTLAGLEIPDAEVLATNKDSLTVRTVEELDALPDGAYIVTAYTFDRDREPLILRHGPDWGLTDKHDLYWWTTDGGDQISSLDRVDDIEHLVLPATVLWTPKETR